MSDKIAAIATGHARTGIGILRLSGNGCIEAAGQVFRLNSGRPLTSLPDRKLALGTLFDAQGRPIDHCMAFISRAPHSYTGEDTAEIQCHGSPAALTAGLEALFAAGFRQARPGEFTRRAFLNGQMDLTQAEAVIDLIDAETADAAANAAATIPFRAEAWCLRRGRYLPSNSFATSSRSWRMGRRWGQTASHLPHSRQSEAFRPGAVWTAL